MNLGVVVEVAIGIIFVWIVFSLTVSQIQEWISSRLDKRAKDMEFAIREMLANPDLKAQLYDHPVIRGLTANKRSKPSKIPTWFYRYPILRGFTKEKRKLPSYIPSQQFALALFDIAMTANTESSLIQQGILRLRDDLKNNNKLTVQRAVIEELNLLAELARSAAATEAGTAITNKTVEMLRKEVEQFVENFHRKYPTLKLDDQVAQLLAQGMDLTLKEAVKLKAEMDDVVSKQPKTGTDTALEKVRLGVSALAVISPEVNQSLNALLMNVEEYAGEKEKLLAKARNNVETWFNDSMDRVSGVYKRYAQNLALLIGILLALLLNVDSITITTYLWRQPSVREALAAQANTFQLDQQQLQTNPEQAMANFSRQFAGINLPVGWTIRKYTQPAYQDPGCQLFPDRTVVTTTEQGSMPVQSFGIPFFGSTTCIAPAQPNNESNLLLLLIGVLITAAAARLGAPFWFDMLKRVVNLRSTGPSPVEKQGSK
jgi:hypothetical protein